MRVPDLSDPRDRTLHGVLRQQAAAIPDATYLWVDDTRVSFAEAEANAHAWAAALAELGVGRGDPVAFLLESCPEARRDYIRHMGRHISSFEVERAIAAHPAVAKAAAIGIPAPELASEAELMVFATLKEGASVGPAELARFVNHSAPYFFLPRFLEITGELPHTPTGRVQKFALRERGVGPQTWDRIAAGFEVTR